MFVSSTSHNSRMSCNNFSLQIAVHGKSFNHSARDAWELFQSTGVEALIAYDCSGAVLLMGTILGGLSQELAREFGHGLEIVTG